MAVDGRWGACIFLDSGGDAMRWARKAFHEGAVDYDRIERAMAFAGMDERRERCQRRAGQ